MVEWKRKPKTIKGTPLARLSTQVGAFSVGWSVFIGCGFALLYMSRHPTPVSEHQKQLEQLTEEQLEMYEKYKLLQKIPFRSSKQVEEMRELAKQTIKFR